MDWLTSTGPGWFVLFVSLLGFFLFAAGTMYLSSDPETATWVARMSQIGTMWVPFCTIELTHRLPFEVEYWPTADPTAIEGNREQRLDAYRAVRDQLLARIKARFA